MNLQRFFGANVREALQLVRATLGADAMILSNRPERRRRRRDRRDAAPGRRAGGSDRGVGRGADRASASDARVGSRKNRSSSREPAGDGRRPGDVAHVRVAPDVRDRAAVRSGVDVARGAAGDRTPPCDAGPAPCAGAAARDGTAARGGGVGRGHPLDAGARPAAAPRVVAVHAGNDDEAPRVEPSRRPSSPIAAYRGRPRANRPSASNRTSTSTTPPARGVTAVVSKRSPPSSRA